LNDPAKIDVTKVTSQTAATIVPSNILSMYSRLEPALLDGSVWLAHPSTITELYRLSAPGQDSVGAASTVFGTSLFSQPGPDAPSGTLLGRPLVFTEKLPTLGTTGDIVLCNLSQVALGMRREISIDVSLDIGFASDTVQFRSIMRFDSQGKWSSAHTPKSGSTMSWVVTLATRS
jgi:HK97 family phage major capsid protein